MLNNKTFAQVHRLAPELEKVFGSGFNDGSPQLRPHVDVWVDVDRFLVEAELPGVKVDEVEIHVHKGDQISIKGERKHDENSGITWIRRERFFGGCSRRLQLNCSIDTEAVKARLKNGVLEIRVPKAAAHQPKKIEIETGTRL